MLKYSQPVDSKIGELIEKSSKHDDSDYTKDKIAMQLMGKLSDVFLDRNGKKRISIGLRLRWKIRYISDTYYDLKCAIRNHFKWHKTLKQIRPWEGHDGLIKVMITHLNDYIDSEEKYGHSEENFRRNKIAKARETVELLERMSDPDEYSRIRTKEVDSRYPDYKHLVSRYKGGGCGFSGRFIPQGNGWAGKEGGKNPREGYFELIDGRYQLVDSPDKNETDRILAEIDRYNEDTSKAYHQAEEDSIMVFDRLCELLKENLYSWWD